MRFWLGIAITIICITSGYLISGGSAIVLEQPSEFIIIVGAAIGSFIIGNNHRTLSRIPSAIKHSLRGPIYKKAHYLELLNLLFEIFKLGKNKGNLALEVHIEKPYESPLFLKFPHFLKQKQAVVFLCDYLRMITLSTTDSFQVEAIMEEELNVQREEKMHMVVAIQHSADGLPALGIIAAVLSIIRTMSAIDQPPAILGRLIGGALVGTFLGVLLSYCLVGPIANCLKGIYDMDEKYILCIKSALLAYINGSPPLVAVEYARKVLESNYRPTFHELEELTQRQS